MKVLFRRSSLYDQALKREKKFSKAPKDEILYAHMRKIEKEWTKHSGKILKELSKITKLKWREKEIVAYVTWGVIPYSNPLTLNLRSDIDTLTHELIHRILSEWGNWQLIKKSWIGLMKKYKTESQTTRVHIVVHAIHALLLKKLFGEKRLKKEKKTVRDPQYIRSWEIAERNGYENIVKELTRNLKS